MPLSFDLLALPHGGGVAGLNSARINRPSNQSIPDNTLTAISFTASVFDTNAFADLVGQPTRLTVPTDLAGLYSVGGAFNFNANASGRRYGVIRLNGTTNIDADERENTGATTGTITSIATLFRLAAADYIELVVLQNSGGALDVLGGLTIAPVLWLVRLGV